MLIGIDGSRAFGEVKTGTEVYSYRLIGSLMRLTESRRHDWVVYTRGGVPDEFVREAPDNWKFQEINLSRLWTQIGLAYRTWCDRLDVLWVPAHTLPVLRRRGVRTVVTVHGLEYEYLPHYYGEWARWHLTWSTEYAVSQADRIIAVSRFTADELVRRLGVCEEKLRVVHEGVEDLSRAVSGGDARQVLGGYGLERGRYLVFVGTLQPRKNLVRLIEAFSGLKADGRYAGLRLVIAGGRGWQYEEILAAPGKYGVEDSVIFTGYINNAKRYILMRYALAYVQPSLTEGFGLPILEAMQYGVPVVSSRAGALGEVVGEAGVMFDPIDVPGMVEAMRKVIDDRGLRGRLVRAGRKRSREFSWERAARETLVVIEELNRPRV